MTPAWYDNIPGYVWDEEAGLYRKLDKKGKKDEWIAFLILVAILIDLHDRAADRFSLLVEDALEGRILVVDLQQALMLELRHLYNASSALAVGGYGNMTTAEFERNALILRGEYRYMVGFMRDLMSGKLTLAQADARVRLYAGKAYSRFWFEHTRRQRIKGKIEERWITRHDERVCHTQDRQGCAELGALGWVPIGSLPNPGDGTTQCLGACRCRKEYR